MEVENDYRPPVAALVKHESDPYDLPASDLPNYVEEVGLTPGDIPELARLSADTEFDSYDGEERPEFAAPLRAAHALGQLAKEAPEEAIAALMALYDQEERWYAEDLSEIIVPIGPNAIDFLVEYLNNGAKPEWSRMQVQFCLYLMSQEYPETTDRFRQELVACLEKYKENPPILNGCLINDLIKLKALETAPLMEAAYSANKVDMSMAGPWAAVQVALGLKQASDFRPEELRVPLHAMPEFIQELHTANPIDVIKSVASSKPKPSSKGFGVNTPPKKSKKKSKKKK